MHTLIIIAKKTFDIIKKYVVSTIIIFLVVFGISVGVVITVVKATNNNSNIQYYKSIVGSCTSVEKKFNTKKIIIRVDDIQAYWLNGLQIKMLDELKSRNMPALLGVIPIGLEDDRQLYNYLKTNSCHFEIALHGWDQGVENGYTLPEFGTLSEAEAREKIKKGKNILQKINSGLITFIPPNDKYSAGTKNALIKEGFKIISAEGKDFFDYSVSTYNFVDGTLKSPNDISTDCEFYLNRDDLCIVAIHPQDYITQGKEDPIKYDLFIKTLNALKNLDAMFATASDLQYWYQIYLVN